VGDGHADGDGRMDERGGEEAGRHVRTIALSRLAPNYPPAPH
jgi:hypothetical protein